MKETRVSLFIAEILGKPLLSLSFNHSERIHRKYIKYMYFIDRFLTYNIYYFMYTPIEYLTDIYKTRKEFLCIGCKHTVDI